MAPGRYEDVELDQRTLGRNARDEDSDSESAPEDVADINTDGLDEDLYGAAICATIRDAYNFSKGTNRFCARAVRVGLSMSLLFVMLGVQIWLVWQMKKLVTAHAVHHIRNVYDAYELHMYGTEPGHTFLSPNGKTRGIKEFFAPANFDTLDHDQKDEICRIPLSQPLFLGVILLIWVLTVIANLKRAVNYIIMFLCSLPTVRSMAEAVEDGEEDGQVVVVGLPLCVKLFLSIFVLLPRILVGIFLLWLGCRWLIATPSYTDLLLNAVALEFILLLKDLLYGVVVSRKYAWEIGNTTFKLKGAALDTTMGSYLPNFCLLLFSLIFVILYMLYGQQVLPEYQWDIKEVCSAFLKKETSV